ncbi:MAG: NAD-dependent epimerase/dehydratase family protein, partial [Candidatus Bathyarchaeia archaeon]
MKLLVTGASGFIGKNLLLKIPKKWEVVATYYKTASFVQFIEKERLRNVQAIQVNLTNFSETREKLNSVGSNFDVAIHLAANTDISLSVREPETDLYCNVTTLVNTIKSSKIKDVIFISSGAIYDGNKGKVSPKIPLRPSFPYAISKLAAEHYLVYMKKYRLIDKYLILRFFGAYGPYEPPRKLFTKLVNAFYFEKKREFMVVGDGNNLIDAMYVEDTIRGLLSAI